MENMNFAMPENLENKNSAQNDQKNETEKIEESGDIVQLVSFNLDQITYGINILSVHEILRMPDITRVPNTPDFIKGVINLRGNVIPVVDIRIRFGYEMKPLTENSRIVVIDTDDKLIGLLVDNVSQVVRTSENNIDPPSDLIEGVSDDFISGVARLHDKLIIILSMDNILFSRQKTEVLSENRFEQ